ncbi:MAG: hypothetical protein WC783_00695 [Candidatus Paceibacterota bacterium]|jgi:hypothetical protein
MFNQYFTKGVVSIDGLGTITGFLFTTPADLRIYARAMVYASDDFTIQIYEDVTTLDDGTPITGFNTNRNSLTAHSMDLFSAPTIDDPGDLIWETRTLATKGIAGVSSQITYEILVKYSTKYYWKITKNTAATHFVDYDFWWVEYESI